MCLAVPARVLEVNQAADTALVSLGGIRRAVSLALVEDTAVGDYVLVHVGYALTRISPEEAERTLELLRELGEPDADAGPPEDQPAIEPAIETEFASDRGQASGPPEPGGDAGRRTRP